jgi:hypothetical protein
MDWVAVLTKQIPGLAPAFAYAAATHGFFLWLDKKASGPAKKAISDWLRPREYDKSAIAAAILELFDRVYTYPLFTWRAFLRSSLITLVVLALFMYEFSLSPFDKAWNFRFTERATYGVLSNVISDYVALFAIRRMLYTNRVTPQRAMLLGPLVGIGIVMSVASLFGFPVLMEKSSTFFTFDTSGWVFGLVWTSNSRFNVLQNTLTAAAFVVHLWLPFFALCVGLLKGLNYFLLASNTAQWFLKRGMDHPLEAVGFVAAPLMFLLAAAVQMLR